MILNNNWKKMDTKFKYLINNIGILSICNLSSNVLLFFLTPLYTSVLSKSEYGRYDFIYSAVLLFFPIFTLNISDAVLRFLMDKETDSAVIVRYGFKWLIFGNVSFGVLLVILELFSFSKLKNVFVFSLLLFVVYSLNQLLIQMSKGFENIKALSIAGLISTFVLVCSNIVLLKIFDIGIIGLFLSNILSLTVSIVYILLNNNIPYKIIIACRDIKIERQMLLFSIPLIFTALGWWVNNMADRFAVTFICGEDANGLLSVSYKIPNILTVIQGIFIQAWQVSALKEYNNKESKLFYSSIFDIQNFFMVVCCSILLCLTRFLAVFLYRNDFYEAWLFVPFLLVSCVFNNASGFLGPILSAKKDSGGLALSAIAGMVVNIVLNVFLVYVIGIQGATIATLVSSIVIYIIRRIRVKEDIVINNAIAVLLTWLLLIIQAILMVNDTILIYQFIILIIILLINFKVINNVKIYIQSINKNN